MEYAVIETGGKQYRVSKGDVLDVERLEVAVGKKVHIDPVLALSDGKQLTVGTPAVEGATVTGEVVEHLRGNKLTVYKKKRRKGYERKIGHRQELTRLKIADFGTARGTQAKQVKTEEAPAEPAAETRGTVAAEPGEGENHGA